MSDQKPLITEETQGRAKRRKDERTSTCLRFDPALHARLAAASAEYGLSINYLVVKAVEDFLPRMIPAAELRLTRSEP